MQKILKIKFIALLLTIIFSGAFVGIVQNKQASAASFNAGNIISDPVMSNHNSMTISQIQSFLNSKVPSCDTQGNKASEYGGGTRKQYAASKGVSPPFTCLKSYNQGGKSASQLIYDAAKQYQINPQVLIALLQKEQGLVTDDWPWPIQYRSATGFGCPDNAPCDSQYYGLKNQLSRAANLFREVLNGGWSNYPVGNNTILWNPNASCGSSNVNIQNRATSALYRYTPYRPNQAALNAGYGTGNSCSSYGNRNFFLYMRDWFNGGTQGNKWTPLLDPRVLVTSQATQKINPDTGATVLSVGAGLEIAFPTKTSLSDGSGCLRTRTDTINNKNSCIRHSNLSEFTPSVVNIGSNSNPVIKQTSQWTCKVNYRTTNATNQCFDRSTKITFLKKTTVAGVDYFITKLDADNNNPTAFRADRITDAPIITTLSGADKIQKNTVWTCKVNLATGIAIESQCYEQDTVINFSKKIVNSKDEYLVTTHDDTHKINSAFLLKRFTPVD